MKNGLKKFVAMLSAFSIVMGMTGVFAAEETAAPEEKPEAGAYITFNAQKPELSNMSVKFGKSNELLSTKTIVERDGRKGWEMPLQSTEWKDETIYINVSDKYAFNMNDYSSYRLEVDYYDQGEGWFVTRYDAMAEPWNNVPQNAINLGRTKMKGSNSWKTATFTLDYPKFKNGVNGADISIGNVDYGVDFADGAVVIGEVRLYPLDTKASVLVHATTDHIGNNFFSDENVSVKLDIYNTTREKQNTQIKITVYDYDEKITHEDSFDIELAAGEHITKQYEYYSEARSVFDMYIEAIADGIHSTEKIQFSSSMAPEGPNPLMGTNTHSYTYSAKDPAYYAPLIERAGISMQRETIRWNMFETAKGVYGPTKMMEEREKVWEQYNVGFMGIIAQDTPKTLYQEGWARGEEAENACVEYAKAVVRHYKGKIKHYEVFNEVQSEIYPGCDAQWYVRLLKRIYTAIKEIDPEICVIAGVTSEIPIAWISEVCESAQGYYDAFSIHPYTMEIDPTTSDRYGAILGCRKAMDQSGAEGIPLWLTELGWPTNFHEYQHQAAYMIHFYAQASRPELGVEKVLFYDFMDDGSREDARASREDTFGIIEEWKHYETPHLAKPAFVAVCNIDYHLANATLKNVSDREYENLITYQYEKPNGEDVLLAYAHPEKKEYTFDFGNSDVKVYDMYGTELDVWSEDGKITLVLDYKPKYIIGNFEDYEITDAVIGINGVEYDVPYDDVLDLKLTRTKDINANIELKLPEGETVIVEENNGFVGSEAIIKLRARGLIGTSEDVVVLVKDEQGNLLREIPVTLNYTEPINFSFKTRVFDNSSFKRWVGVITIRNNSHSHAISGKIDFKSPSEFVEKIKSIKMPEIPPDTEKEIRFNLPEIKNYKSYFMDVDVVLDTGFTKSFNFYSDCSAATYAEVKPTIDGVMSPGEWDERMSLRMAEGSEYLDFTFGTGSYTGADDLSANVFFEWDEDNFYMFAKVKDDVFSQEQLGDGMWLGDSIQFGMTYTGAQKDGVQAFTEIGLAKLSTGEYIARYTNENGATGQNKDSELKVTQENEMTYYELKMPWSELIVDDTVIKGGDRIRFNIILNEDDGEGRYGWLEYSSGVGQIKDATLFGTLNLMDTRDYSKQAIAYNVTSFEAPYEDTIELEVSKRLNDAATIEVVAPESGKLKVLENNGFVGNEAIVKLQGVGFDGEYDIVKVIVKDAAGNVVSEQDIDISYKSAVSVELKTEPESLKNLDKWIATAVVKNNSNERAVKGSLKFVAPEAIASLIGEIEIPEIAAGESAEIAFDLPEIDYNTYSMKMQATLDSGYTEEYEVFGNWLSAAYATTAPVVDGVMSPGEWDDTSCLKLTSDNFHLDYSMGGGTMEGDDDLSADVYIKWDEDNFYMFTEVTDDIYFTKSAIYHMWHIDRSTTRIESWEGDSLQIGIANDIGRVSDKTAFTELGFAHLADYGGPWITRYTNESGLAAETSDKSQLQVINNGTKTCYEVAIPWTELVAKSEEIGENKFLRFNIIVNENDYEGRYGWLEFAGGIGESKNPSLFGWLKLVGNN